MRFLAPDEHECPVLDSAANVMRAIAFVREIGGQSCRCFRQIEVVRAHHFQDRRTHKLQKSYKSGHRISRQTEYSTSTGFTEKKWFPWFNGHAPDVDLGSEGA